MKTAVELPADATRWLRSVNRRLGALASGERAEIVDGLRAHLIEAIADGEDPADVIAPWATPPTWRRRRSQSPAPLATRRACRATSRPSASSRSSRSSSRSAGAFLLIYLEATVKSINLVVNVTVSRRDGEQYRHRRAGTMAASGIYSGASLSPGSSLPQPPCRWRSEGRRGQRSRSPRPSSSPRSPSWCGDRRTRSLSPPRRRPLSPCFFHRGGRPSSRQAS